MFILTLVNFIDSDVDEVCSPERNIALTVNEPSLLNSMGYPQYRITYVDCVWIATAPAGATVLFKFVDLNFQEGMEGLVIGFGDDSQNRLSTILRSWNFEVIPGPVFTGKKNSWIRYATFLPYNDTYRGFQLEMWATKADGKSTNCTFQLVYILKITFRIHKTSVG